MICFFFSSMHTFLVQKFQNLKFLIIWVYHLTQQNIFIHLFKQMLILHHKMQNIALEFLKLIKSHECRLLQIIKIVSNLHKIFRILQQQQQCFWFFEKWLLYCNWNHHDCINLNIDEIIHLLIFFIVRNLFWLLRQIISNFMSFFRNMMYDEIEQFNLNHSLSH